ncbi:MAG: transposase domain-containing protein [Acidobacteriota bacterium]|nr:transposase domain-containing protein [Acidobacteriota bacterium]
MGILRSLLQTCRLQGLSPYRYLVDVLQRVDSHPASEVALLTPRLWKERFAEDPLLAPLERHASRTAH